jgi:predicted outer membrane repeat protein
MKTRTKIIAVLGLLALCSIGLADELLVPSQYSTIQSAINAAFDGDTVLVADGVCTGDGNRDIDFLGKAVTVRSESGPDNCIIDCNGTEAEPHRGFYFHSSEDTSSILDGFTVINGYAKYEGGAIYCLCSSPTLKNCVFLNNFAEYNGGAIYGGYSSTYGLPSNPIVTNCTFIANTAQSGAGGGAVYGCSSMAIFENCVFENNGASSGGAVYGSSANFINCSFINNYTFGTGGYADGTGGAVKCWSSHPKLINCLIANNSANSYGGAVYAGYHSKVTLIQCTVANNHAGTHGGGLYAIWSYLSVKGSIICDNADYEIYLAHDIYRPAKATVLYSNIEGGQSGVYVPSSATLNWASGNIEAPPEFLNPSGGDYRLSSLSPCIDNGVPYYCLQSGYYRSLDGNCRLQGDGVDIGCYEFGTETDTDADLLSDESEIEYSTDIFNRDTDADGLPDGVEILRGTDPLLENEPNGICVPVDYPFIQQALFLAFPNEVVTVSPGIYNEILFFDGKNVTLQGSSPLDNSVVEDTVIDAQGLDSVITFYGSETPDCILRGFSIKGGNFSGINGNGCKALVERNIITDNFMPSMSGNSGGGGILNCDGTIQYNSIIYNSAAEAGGGIARCDGLVRYNIISSNTSGYRGGGIYECEGFILNNVIANNSSKYGAGGIYYDRGFSATIANCLIASNTTGYGNYGNGGGIYCEGGNINIFNSTIVDNRAGGTYARGAGIYCERGSVTVKNCILQDNQGNYQIYIMRTGTELTISYSNIENGKGGVYIDQGNLNWGYGNSQENPFFATPHANYHLSVDSPCINAGDPNYVAEPNETDLDGLPRIIGGRIDMGAYEFNHQPVADAGPNQTAYAWIDGFADVNLDGSGSYDDDNDVLDYYWSWTIDGNDYKANGVSPTIQLPVGEHIIKLVVNDGIDDSEPDQVTITVIEPMESRLRIWPRLIKRKSHWPRTITAWMRLPQGITKDQIDKDEPLMLYPGGIEAIRQFVFQKHRRYPKHTSIFAFFNKAELMEAVPENGQVELQVVGQLKSGQYFYGSDTIRIIAPWPPHRLPHGR